VRPSLVVLGVVTLFATLPIFISIVLSRPCFGGAACENQAALLPYLAVTMGLSLLALAFGLLAGPRP
jgi:hypothetical protein